MVRTFGFFFFNVFCVLEIFQWGRNTKCINGQKGQIIYLDK